MTKEQWLAAVAAQEAPKYEVGQIWRGTMSDAEFEIVGIKVEDGVRFLTARYLAANGKYEFDSRSLLATLVRDSPDNSQETAAAVQEKAASSGAAQVAGYTHAVWLGGGQAGDVIQIPRRPIQPPRAHDFSNPYCFEKGERVCAACGLDNQNECRPQPEWRMSREYAVAEAMARRDLEVAAKVNARQRSAPYRNDVAGIGARLGGYLNVALERGR